MIYKATEHKLNARYRALKNCDLDKHIDNKCGQIMSMLCDKIWHNRTLIKKHNKECLEKRNTLVVCHKCLKMCLKMHKLLHKETRIQVPYKAIAWLPSMWNCLEHRRCSTKTFKQRAQYGAFTIKGELLPLEEGNLYRWVDDEGYSC